MAAPSADLKRLLLCMKLSVLPEDYLAIRLPLDSKPIPGEWYRAATTRFALFVKEPKGICLVVSRRKWLRMQNLFEQSKVSPPIKIIAFDRKMSLVAAGYMSTIGKVLADAKILVLPLSTQASDYIAVNKSDLPRAVRLLRQFIKEC
jgi:hypothetical protein